MAAALTLAELGDDREVVLFDTFEGMPPPGEHDSDLAGVPAAQHLAADVGRAGHVWAVAGREDVDANLASTGYQQVRFVEGRVEDTIPTEAPDRIAVLRLDTDWYESTLHELQHLYPRLASGGVLLIDDYGHWQGARKAVDEYLAGLDHPVFLARTDYTGRSAMKP